jgi:hypothetical protein
VNHVTASCGHAVIAVGAPGSQARMECERMCKTCMEKAARAWLYCNGYIAGLFLDMDRKTVTYHGRTFAGLVEFARWAGWEA